MLLDTDTGIVQLTNDITLKPSLTRQEFESFPHTEETSPIIRTLIQSSYSIPQIIDNQSQTISAIIDFRMDLLYKVCLTSHEEIPSSGFQDKRYTWGYLKTEPAQDRAYCNVILTYFTGEDAIEPMVNIEFSQLLYRLTTRKAKSRFNLFANLFKRQPKAEHNRILASRAFRKDTHLFKSDIKVLISQYVKSISENPADMTSRFALAQLMFTKGSVHEAISEFTKILNQNPNHLPSLKALGCILFEQEDYASSSLMFSHLVYLSPYDAEARHDLGQSLIAQGCKEQGIHELREALVIRPGTRLFSESLDTALNVIN